MTYDPWKSSYGIGAEHPVLFNGPMVRSILDLRKSQTRRKKKRDKPPCIQNDMLWVRESFNLDILAHSSGNGLTSWDAFSLLYKADDASLPLNFSNGKPNRPGVPSVEKLVQMYDSGPEWPGCRPSIHMPRWASRIFLLVEDVWEENLLDISEADAMAEGFESRQEFLDGFYQMNKLTPGMDAPVWAIKFILYHCLTKEK